MAAAGFCAGFAFFLVLLTASSVWLGIHKVQEGHVGLYYRGGALLEAKADPGWHTMIPWVTFLSEIQITLQTDTVVDIPCGTSGGVMIYFDKIEVVNQLDKAHAHQTVKLYGVNYDKTWIFDKIHHEINQFCSAHTLEEVYIEQFATLDEALAKALQRDCDKWNTGINVIAIRVTKPRIPTNVRKNYEAVEQEKTEMLIAQQKQNVIIRQEETKKMQATIQAEKEMEVSLINSRREASVATIDALKFANVSKIRAEMEIQEKEGERTMIEIENEMMTNKERTEADALHYLITQEAEANRIKFTDEFLRVVLYESLSNNTNIFFGDQLPKMFFGTSDQDKILRSSS
eukprot:TRINITY_DN3480_c0_g1_i1.p1 TRINITY_DN3480_c0_g1~~TRINITY_DN3480_c0_g1_i1.p1  ORF type:complete len:345 (-),score=69.22 TRINITY_DN3480_c0_g1_i1:63-1097(-)